MDQLLNEEIEDFREAYKEDFNEELSQDDARIMLWQLVEFYRAIARPLPGQQGEGEENNS